METGFAGCRSVLKFDGLRYRRYLIEVVCCLCLFTFDDYKMNLSHSRVSF